MTLEHTGATSLRIYSSSFGGGGEGGGGGSSVPSSRGKLAGLREVWVRAMVVVVVVSWSGSFDLVLVLFE